ncbi:MAG: lysine--tRNA ligase, partial [Candidatus Hermodarchaeota archaeon]
SYGEHMSSLLLDSLDAAGIDYRHKSAAKLYKEGVFTDQITILLRNADRAGQIIQEVTGQEKYTESIPFHPICKECKKIYTTVVNDVDFEKHQVSYTCEDAEIGGKSIAGCGYPGIADYSKGEGKLSWKVEFASRWAALQIDFEPYGKDILESVKVNDRICREILGYEPPYHIKYEMFLDKGGSKISKSKGNVFTPQMWYRYGTPQSLVLLTLKRIEGTRSLSIDDIPRYMDEIDDLSALYFGLKKEKNPNQAMRKKALYEYCWWLNPPQQYLSTKTVPYTLLSLLVQYAPTDTEEDFVRSKLLDYGYLSSPNEWKGSVVTKFKYARTWTKEQIEEDQELKIELSEIEIKALEALVEALPNAKTDNEINTAIVTAAEANGLKTRKFYPLLYQIFLGTTHGPKIASLFKDMGVEKVVKKINAVLN